jgi:putative phosphonate metabolism protein
LRYALYFTPPKDDPLTSLAARWLGRDAFSNEIFSDKAMGPVPEGHAELTDDPRRYGFHATLKAPFELATSVTERDLLEIAAEFAAQTKAFTIPELVLGQLGHFFALVPGSLYQPLQDFASRVVKTFEPFRAPLSDHDIARRKPEGLTEPQRANLLRWGYPYVNDEFRFHMTLTGRVPSERQPELQEVLSERFAEHTGKPLDISGLAIFAEGERGTPFTVRSWLPLTGASK